MNPDKAKEIQELADKYGTKKMSKKEQREFAQKYFAIIKKYEDPNKEAKERETIKGFEVFRNKYLDIREKYLPLFEPLYEAVKKNAVRYEYAKGGKTIHRGYYSPSSTDLVVGGCGRGRLVKSKPSEFDYEYIFDENDRLICCEKYEPKQFGMGLPYNIEILFYEDNKVFSVVYNPRRGNDIEVITECLYEQSRPVEFYILSHNKSLLFEKASYSKLGIEALYHGECLFGKGGCLSHYMCEFNRDSDGLLTSYVPVDIYTGIPSEKAVYPISKKNRKR